MDEKKATATIKPLLFGRIARVLFGLVTLGIIPVFNPGGVGLLVLLFLGISFLVSGMIANPGCEITALLNIFLPSNKKVHFM